jgi:aryl-alcohol dehydrogenase-like predicted oxidoreductase
MRHPRLSEIQRDDIYDALGTLKGEGKILYWGALLDPDPNNLEVGELLMRFRKLSALQVTYNMLEQDPACELIALANKMEISVIASVTESRQPEPWRQRRQDLIGFHKPSLGQSPRDEWKMDYEKKMKELHFLVRGREMNLAQATLKFALKESSVASALVAIRTEAELNECAALSECPDLSEEEIRMVRHLYKNNFYISAKVHG